MKQRFGTFVTKKSSGEPFKAYVPPKLPPKLPIDSDTICGLLEKASIALTELNTMAKIIPNTSLRSLRKIYLG